MLRLSVEWAQRFCEDVLRQIGMVEAEAAVGAESILFGSIMGIDSHGVATQTPRMAEQVRLGNIDPRARVEVLRRSAGSAALDAHRGVGHFQSRWCMDLAMEMARETGLGAVAVRNCDSFGPASRPASLALAGDMVGIAMCNAPWRVGPYGGRERVHGTNPIAVAVPAGDRFKERVAKIVDECKAIPPQEGFAEVLVPGEREYREAEVRRREGIPVDEAVWASVLDRLRRAEVDVERALAAAGG